jgi:hypothetical protein
VAVRVRVVVIIWRCFWSLQESRRVPLGGHEKFYGLVGVVRECRRPIGRRFIVRRCFVSLLSVLLEGIVWLLYVGCCRVSYRRPISRESCGHFTAVLWSLARVVLHCWCQDPTIPFHFNVCRRTTEA